MQRVTISLDEGLAAAFDALVAARGYASRSEAVRDLVRAAVDARAVEASGAAPCVAALSYVYDHHARGLAGRLVAIGHAHHDLVMATMHVHLDHDHCLESVMLKGPTGAVRAFADAVLAERGVRFGAVNLVSVAPGGAHEKALPGHAHGHDGHLTPPRG